MKNSQYIIPILAAGIIFGAMVFSCPWEETPLSADSGVKLYRVSYPSMSPFEGRIVVLYCGPDRGQARAVYHAGTNETRLEIILDAGTEDFEDDVIRIVGTPEP